MRRSSPPAAPLPPEADKPRVVVDYTGMQVLDAREHIQVRLLAPPPRGLRWCLKDAGFTATPGGVIWKRPASPDAIFQAQAIGSLFFPGDKTP